METKLTVIEGRKAEVTGFDLIDVTGVASGMANAIPGWWVRLTRPVWDRYVEVPANGGTGDDTGSRLWDLCSNLWTGLRFARHPADWVLGGFDFAIGKLHSDVDSSTPRPERWRFPVAVRLDVAAVIAPDGSPLLVVFSARDHFDHEAARRQG